MIEIPYKLDLILKTSYKPNIPQEHLKQINSTNSINSINSTNSTDLIHANLNKSNPIIDIEINLFVNKLKLIILNMGLSDIYWLETDIETGFNLKIEITNKNRLNEKNYYEYILSNGIIGPIKLNFDSELRKYMNLNTDELILQLVDYHIKSTDEFIDKWKNDKNICSNIPEIFFYGKITNDSGDLLSYYYITKKYYNYSDIIKQNDFNFAINYLKKLLKLFDNLISRKYIYRNLNMFELGYEIISNTNIDTDNIKIIILGYTITTLLSLNDNFFNQFKISRCNDKKCLGNLTPYYVIDDYYNLETKWLERLNKFYSLGLVEIILLLFYTNDNNLTKIYDFIIGPSIFESQLHYYHFYKRFNSDTNIHNLILLIEDLNLRYCNINPIFESKLKQILINLLNKDYNQIYYPNQIKNLIEKIEESNDEFKIKYFSKEQIYDPSNDNYLKIKHDLKQKIISDDNLNNMQSKNEFLNLYKKYKYKYINLKKKTFIK